MFKRIYHVEIVTDQLARNVQFYTEVLVFTVKSRDRIERSGLGVPIDLVYLDLGGTVVELISYEGASIDSAPEKEHLGYRMIALEVDDMQKAADYLKTKGVDIVWGPRVRETYSRAEICDPNGYRSELASSVSYEALETGPLGIWFARDSPPEGEGFEPSVPRRGQ